MKNRLLSLALLGIAACAPPAEAQTWGTSLEYSTDGHSYALARGVVTPDALIRPEWKSLYWNFGLVGGRDLTDGTDAGGGSFMLKVQGSSGFYAGATFNALSKAGVSGLTGHVSLSFGFFART